MKKYIVISHNIPTKYQSDVKYSFAQMYDQLQHAEMYVELQKIEHDKNNYSYSIQMKYEIIKINLIDEEGVIKDETT